MSVYDLNLDSRCHLPLGSWWVPQGQRSQAMVHELAGPIDKFLRRVSIMAQNFLKNSMDPDFIENPDLAEKLQYESQNLEMVAAGIWNIFTRQVPKCVLGIIAIHHTNLSWPCKFVDHLYPCGNNQLLTGHLLSKWGHEQTYWSKVKSLLK